MEDAAYLAQPRARVLILLRVIVTSNPPGGDIARHGKLSTLLLDDKVGEVVLQRKLVAKAQAIVIHTEPHNDVTPHFLLMQCHSHLIVVIAYLALFAPHRLPRLVK